MSHLSSTAMLYSESPKSKSGLRHWLKFYMAFLSSSWQELIFQIGPQPILSTFLTIHYSSTILTLTAKSELLTVWVNKSYLHCISSGWCELYEEGSSNRVFVVYKKITINIDGLRYTCCTQSFVLWLYFYLSGATNTETILLVQSDQYIPVPTVLTEWMQQN
jgi:hypothetical protein